MDKIYFVGLDIGTTGCKVTVYRADGSQVGRLYESYPIMRTTSEHEIDAMEIRKAVYKVLTGVAATYPGIVGIGVTSFGESFVLLDENDHLLQNTMLYTDTRGTDECEILCDNLGRDYIARVTGVNPHAMYSITKLMWVKKHRPQIYARAKYCFLIEDYIVYLLTGERQIDYSLASRTMAFDIHSLTWSKDVFTAADIEPSLFSAPVPIGTTAGTIKKGIANELGLDPNILILSCGHDQVAAAVGSCVFDDGIAVDGAGTVECITPVFSGGINNDILTKNNYAIVPYVEYGKYICYAFSFAGGALLEWYVKNFIDHTKFLSDITGIFQALEGNKPLNRPSGILVLPHFAGAATPYMDSGSKGAIIGLTLSTSQKEIYYGLMEGVCYEMLLNIQRLNEAGVVINEFIATGGGANSKTWLQMKADILNTPITSLNSTEAGGMGCAIMTSVAVGIYPDIRTASKHMISKRETYYPRKELNKQYADVYSKYEKLYNSIRPLV